MNSGTKQLRSDERRPSDAPPPAAGGPRWSTIVYQPERRRRHRMSEGGVERLLRFVAPLAAIVLWELLVRIGALDDRFFPEPSSLGPAVVRLIEDGTLASNTLATLLRILAGFAIGAIPAIVIGLLMGISRWVRYSLQPIFSSLYPIPKIAILPLLILIFGLGEWSKIMVVALGVFFIVVFNTVAGVVSLPAIFRDAGRNFGAKGFFEFRTIAFPGALPHIFTGLRLAMGTAMLVLISAEFVGAQKGLGYMIWQSWQIFDIEALFVGLTTIALLGYVLIQLIETIERIVVRWRY